MFAATTYYLNRIILANKIADLNIDFFPFFIYYRNEIPLTRQHFESPLNRNKV